MYILECPKKIITEFKNVAKKAFPSEILCYLEGTIEYDLITIDDLWIPDNVLKYCNHNTVNIQDTWAVNAIEYAKDNDMEIIGTLHSHPYTKEELSIYSCTGNHQSESDIDSCGLAWKQISGICVIKEFNSGRLSSSIRFWGPTVPLGVRII